MDALKKVIHDKIDLKVACSEEWKESRPKENTEEKVKPFDWSFTTDYSGTMNDKFRVEKTDQKIDMFKLMKREPILFYHDLTLFEDELHDHGISVLSVKVVGVILLRFSQILNFYNSQFPLRVTEPLFSIFQRVMPSGFFILLRFFMRVDRVMIKMNDTRYHYEYNNNYILKEYTSREAKIEQLKHVPPPLFINPNEIAEHIPIVEKINEKIIFE